MQAQAQGKGITSLFSLPWATQVLERTRTVTEWVLGIHVVLGVDLSPSLSETQGLNHQLCKLSSTLETLMAQLKSKDQRQFRGAAALAFGALPFEEPRRQRASLLWSWQRSSVVQAVEYCTTSENQSQHSTASERRSPLWDQWAGSAYALTSYPKILQVPSALVSGSQQRPKQSC